MQYAFKAFSFGRRERSVRKAFQQVRRHVMGDVRLFGIVNGEVSTFDKEEFPTERRVDCNFVVELVREVLWIGERENVVALFAVRLR